MPRRPDGVSIGTRGRLAAGGGATPAVTLYPTGIGTGAAFGVPGLQVRRSLLPAGLASAEAVEIPSLQGTAPAGSSLQGVGVGSAAGEGSPNLLFVTQFLTPAGIVSSEASEIPSLVLPAPADQSGQLVGISSAEGTGRPDLRFVTQFLAPTGLPSAEAVEIPALVLPVDAAQHLQLVGLSSPGAFGQPAVWGVLLVDPAGVATAGAWGIPNARRADAITVTTGLPTAEALAPGAMKNDDRIAPAALPSAEAWGIPGSDSTHRRIVDHSLTSEEGLGVPNAVGGVTGTTTTTTTPPPLPGRIAGVPAAIPAVIDQLVAGAGLRKKTRFTRIAIDYPVFATAPFFRLPYNRANGLPTIREETPVRNIDSYQIQEADNLAAAQLSVKAQNSEAGLFAGMIAQNELLKIEERYSDTGGTTTGWLTVGVYMIDAVNPSAGEGRSGLDVTGRDVFKLLTFPGCEEWLAADKIHVPRRQLRFKTMPRRDHTSYYVLVDGSPDAQGRWTQTYNWAAPPVPRLWRVDSNERINYRDGTIQLLYGTGEIVIDQDYMESRRRVGGINLLPETMPGQWIEAEYSRYCLPEDERVYTVAGISNDGLGYTLNRGRLLDADPDSPLVEPLYDWHHGLTLVVLTGGAQNQRHRIAQVNPSAMTVTLQRNARDEGLALGDFVRVGEANRLEHALERVLLSAGFQNTDPAGPFFMALTKPQTAFTEPARRELQLTVPTVDEFDFRGDRRVTFIAAYERLRDLMPPFMQLWADEKLRLVYAPVGQSRVPQYTLAADLSAGQIESTDAAVMTRVLYSVRDRSPRNLAYLGNAPNTISAFHFYNSPLAPDPTANTPRGPYLWRGLGQGYSYAEPWHQNKYDEGQGPAQAAGESDADFFEALVRSYICDDNPDTLLSIENDDAGTSAAVIFDGLPVFHIGFVKPFRLKEIHFTIWPWNRGQNISELMFWEAEWSMDGQYWEPLGDEFGFGRESRKILTPQDFGIVDCQWLRFSISKAATWRIDGTFSARKIAFATVAGLAVYADDVIRGGAELGVDRFDLQTEVTGAGPGYLDLAVPVQAAWLAKPIWVEPLGQIAPPTGFAGNRLLVTGDPAASGVTPGRTVFIEQGETDADFARDQERRRRLGSRTYAVPTVDEVGYYIVQQRQLTDPSYSLLRYAQDKAREYLAEISQEFFPLTVTGLRPDMRLRDTATLDLSRLGFRGDAYVREVTRNGDGTLQCKATPFRAAAVRTYSATENQTTTDTVTTTVSTTGTTTGTSTVTTTATSTSSTTTTISTQAQARVTLGGRAAAS